MAYDHILQNVNNELRKRKTYTCIGSVEVLDTTNGRIELLVKVNGVGYRCGFEKNGKRTVSLYASRMGYPMEPEKEALGVLCDVLWPKISENQEGG
ncbi:MAG: hypothetical protein V1690_03185 [Candidatus Moraniibacteriota bacterium]